MRVEDADQAGLQVVMAAARVVEVAEIVARQADGHGVDGEVAAAQVLGQRRGLDAGQRPGLVVGLAAGGGQVEGTAAGAHGGGAESLVLAGIAAQRRGQLAGRPARVALHRQVDVHRHLAEQQVAHRAAHQVHGREVLERGKQLLHPGEAPDPLAQRGVRAHRRTGTPARRMCSLASRTECLP